MRFFLLLVFSAVAGASSARQESWLNARECGASGSRFSTTALIMTGSREITVADAGDFAVGQGIMVSQGNVRVQSIHMWGAGVPNMNQKPVNNSAEIRGYDGTQGSWNVYLLDIKPTEKPAFRWTPDLGRTWHPEQPITGEWQPLAEGVEVRLHERDWENGYVIAFIVRDQLVTQIEKIEGNVLTLKHAVNRSVPDAVVRHNDSAALQAAIDRALEEKRNLYVPIGHYRLAQGLQVRNPSAITIEGASSTETVLDISEGEDACITLLEGTEVTIRNFRMVGFMGFEDRDMAGGIHCFGAPTIWGFCMKHCCAIATRNTERVLVENCHASRMSGECFVAFGRSRGKVEPGNSHTKKITYLRCSVTDSARNAFNDGICGIENTDILHCRIVDVGGCSWEGASRFVTFKGNYVRNAGTVAIGNLGVLNRDETFPDLGAGQTLVADNVFEGGSCYGSAAVRTARGSTQVRVCNNIFVNWGSTAIGVGDTSYGDAYPAANTVVSGNIIDMTAMHQPSARRIGIQLNSDDVIISDNQLYTRGTNDANVIGMCLREPSINAIIHGNLLRNCGIGIETTPSWGLVMEAVDERTFGTRYHLLPMGWQPHLYKDWTFAWFNKAQEATAEIESFDPLGSRFTLKQPLNIQEGNLFEVRNKHANWNIHNNTIIECAQPIILNSAGSATSIIHNNLIVTGGSMETEKAILHKRGNFQLRDNQLH